MEKEQTLLPIVIKVNNLCDLIEASGGQTALMHLTKNGKNYYYYYLTLGESTTVIIVFQDEKSHKRYVGTKNNKVVESDCPDSDCPIPIIDITNDPIVESSIDIWFGEEVEKKEMS